MLFNSYIFILLFLPVTLIGFYLLSRQKSDLWVIWINLCSIVFYGYWSLGLLAVFVASICTNHLIAKRLTSNRESLLILGVFLNLALLGYFKYCNFFLELVNETLRTQFPHLDIILPVGISFYTFQQIAYLVDCYQSKTAPIPFRRYFFFVSFFPQLIAGPIVHHAEIFDQFGKHRKHVQNFAIGFSIFSFGLFKKVFIADTMATISSPIFNFAEAGGHPDFLIAWLGALAYSLQIYFDFSAYSDMAIGLARMFGFKLPQNFASPYKATSVTDFWRRWHITLSRFLRDYLYIPLGGNRKGPLRRYLNLMITMVLGGFWHGANWTFVIWGTLHGLYLVIHQSLAPKLKTQGYILPRPWAWGLTMLAIIWAWVPFRAESMETTIRMWQGMALMSGFHPTPDITGQVSWSNGLLVLGMMIICITAPNLAQIFSHYKPTLPTPGYTTTILRASLIRWRPTILWAMVCVMIFWLCLLKLNDPSEFLYFQF